MIGQINLLNKLNNYTVDTFPRSTLITGEKGSGKHTLVNYIRDNIIKFPLIDITPNLSEQYISQIYVNPNPSIYLINLDEIVEKDQNVILKLAEEPLNNAFIIILASSKASILPTVINRCTAFELENYTKAELSNFIPEEYDKDLLLSIFRTPGQILSNNLSTVKDLCDLCDKIIEKLAITNYANILNICNKINYKDEYDKFELESFLDALLFRLYNKYLESNDIKYLDMYLLTVEERKKLLDKRLNKEIFMRNYITKLWKLTRG